MRYRWCFDEGGVLTECLPIIEDDTAQDYAPQTNEVFYRAKMNGTLSFRFEFDAILAKGYNYTHIVVLQSYNESDDTWVECWKGRFCLTDCEIDYDTHTINVQPETLDRYTAILDALENEYNLVKLAPVKQYVDILIRPCLQIYSLNSSKITNYIGNNWWESSCEALSYGDNQLNYFRPVGDYFAVQVKWASGVYAGMTINYVGTTRNNNHILTGKIYSGDVEIGSDTIHISRSDQQGNDISLLQISKNSILQGTVTFEYHGAGLDPIATYVSPDGSAAEINAQWYDIYNRILVNTDLDYIDIDGQRLGFYDLAADDMAGTNLNYNKCLALNYSAIQVDVYDGTQEEPTQWGMSYYEDRYFKKLPDVPPYRYSPVGIDLWKYVSLWWYAEADSPSDVTYKQICDALPKKQRIADCYTLSSTIVKLMQAAGWTGNLISKLLNGTNDYVGDPFIPVISPRSNVISSYYATPAQNAPISLAMCFNMLKNVYKAYWYIDDNNDLHIEHISYFRNGLAYYEDQTGLLVDLEARLHTDTKSNKVYWQNKVKFDKQDMPERFTFGWADVQTKPFDGWPIICNDAYVQKGQTEERIEGKFDSDVDYVLTSPSDVTKDGFFLFAVPVKGGTTDWSLDVQSVHITDEEGESYDIEIQNADAAYVKIHQSFWRYDLPCEQINVNNNDTVALTTGNFKSQSIEFADTIMADLLTDIANCIKVIRTQQGDGHIKSMSINLNSLHTKTELLFNFIGRWYYLRGTALGASIDIIVNNNLINLEVSGNKFLYRYQEPISQLDFHSADVVSVDFSDCDALDNLTSADNMFDGCEELIAVDFGNKTLAAVISADYMFRGCVNLTTLLCPSSSTWQPDIDFSDCPLLTEASFYEFIDYLYDYTSGVHTITPNTTMWNALDAAVQNDMLTKASAKGWTIAIPAQYSITGHSTSSTVYATINGSAVEIPVTAGVWSYDYNAAITSISFEADTNVTDIDFSLSDGLAGVTSLTDAFKGCTSLTSVDFSNCDLSNVATASDAFANCTSLYELTIPQDTWQPDIDLSSSVMPKSEMLNVINGLYNYNTGTHTVTFNSTIWDAMSVADQQAVFNAADAKGWETNAVAVVYVVRGTSSNVNGTETFNIQFINDGSLSPSVSEQITCVVDGNGDWSFTYDHKKIYRLNQFAKNKTTISSVDFSQADDFSRLYEATESFSGCSNLTTANFSNQTFANVVNCYDLFWGCTSLTTLDLSKATFANAINARRFLCVTGLTSINLPLATFASATNVEFLCSDNPSLTTISLPLATFANATLCGSMFCNCPELLSLSAPSSIFGLCVSTAYSLYDFCENDSKLQSVDLSSATFASLNNAKRMFLGCAKLTSIDFSSATFENLINAERMFMNCAELTTIIWPQMNMNKLQVVGGAGYGMFLGCAKLSNASILPFADLTLPNLTTLANLFYGCAALTKIDLHSAILGNVTICYTAFGACANLTEIDLSAATLAKVNDNYINTYPIFLNDSSLTTIKTTQQNTAILPSSQPTNGSMRLDWSPLTYQSMLNVANWLSDLTGYTAHTCTFKATAWNALSSAEQSNIDTILSGKNWNRAIA